MAAPPAVTPLDQLWSYRAAKAWREVRRRFRSTALPSIGIWHRFYKPPYGGGNQFLLALAKELRRQGLDVFDDPYDPRLDAFLVNAVNFDTARLRDLKRGGSAPRVVHRVNGPFHRYRDTGMELDRRCRDINAEFADATIVQSEYTRRGFAEMGIEFVNPVIIPNAVDETIFHPRDRRPNDRDRKTKLIATSWSRDWRKGVNLFQWMDDNLDWDRFEFIFLGNVDRDFKHIRVLPPVGTEGVAAALRTCDIYVMASMHDSCSNAVIEAMACGLPVLYLNSGGTPELVGAGGLPFDEPDAIPVCLDTIRNNHAQFQGALAPPRLADVARRYMDILIPGWYDPALR